MTMLLLPLGRLKEKNQERKIETLPSEKQSETKKMGRHGLRLKEAEDRVRARERWLHSERRRERHEKINAVSTRDRMS